MSIPHVALGSRHIPAIVYGTAWKKDDTADCVQRALLAGFRGIDTACQPKHYHELGVGNGVAAYLQSSNSSRADLYLQTKFTPLSGQDPKTVPYDRKAPLAKQVQQSVQVSLCNLQTDYLDTLVLHSAVEEKQALPQVWGAMQDAVAAGHVRQLGISNCYDPSYLERLYLSARVKPVVLQNRFYRDTGYDKSLRAFCRNHGMVYQSFWTLSANPQLLSNSALVTLTRRYQRSAAQVLFRYLTQQSIVPLTGTKSDAHLKEDAAIFEFSLTEPECATISALLE